jgi:DNA-binding NarL/FixJ family response regulator
VARTVLVVDDHGGFRRMARLLLQRAGLVVIGEAESAAEAIAVAGRLEPDLVLLDVLLPDGEGTEVADRLSMLPHPPGVVFTSSHTAQELGPRLDRASVLGFVRKDDLSVARLTELLR